MGDIADDDDWGFDFGGISDWSGNDDNDAQHTGTNYVGTSGPGIGFFDDADDTWAWNGSGFGSSFKSEPTGIDGFLGNLFGLPTGTTDNWYGLMSDRYAASPGWANTLVANHPLADRFAAAPQQVRDIYVDKMNLKDRGGIFGGLLDAGKSTVGQGNKNTQYGLIDFIPGIGAIRAIESQVYQNKSADDLFDLAERTYANMQEQEKNANSRGDNTPPAVTQPHTLDQCPDPKTCPYHSQPTGLI